MSRRREYHSRPRSAVLPLFAIRIAAMRSLILLTVFSGLALPVFGQQASKPPEPSLRRWFEFQQFAVYTRYRFTENSRNVTTTNQQQYKDSIRARVNFDPDKRYTLNVGYFTGSSFISSWDNLGWGNNTTFDRKNNYFKQIYGDAIPVRWLELQYGGLYLNRGEGDEFAYYDEDGYVTGERVSLRRPKDLYLDELTITRGAVGPQNLPNIFDRGAQFSHPNYTQLLGVKRFTKIVAGSLEYNRLAGADMVRGAVTFRFSNKAPISLVRFEEYHRFNLNEGTGFAVWSELPVTKYARLQVGYGSIDQFYGGWNGDRMQSGRRIEANGTITIYGPLSTAIYYTAARRETYTVPIYHRFDWVVQYDVLSSLKKTGLF